LNSDLKTEIEALDKRIWDLKVKYQIEENTSVQTGFSLASRARKLAKIEATAEGWRTITADLQREFAEKKEKEQQSNADLEDVLDRVFEKSKRVRETQASIEELKRSLSESEATLSEKQKEWSRKLPERDAVRDTVRSVRKEIEETVNEVDELKLVMRVTLAGLELKEQYIEATADDIVKQTALALSYVNGYDAGIDPIAFPDLI
jgi:predicted  nucleic acid-binding Zn-ribbon protein